ncbi:MAG: ribosome silencing factor [Bacteroidetes bacterium]|nr:MAG: ribosome silencing factor [Bacteroidota bacterium]RLD86435.1 MAG: ribosome silencing factor [Bacteroidota bacterium]
MGKKILEKDDAFNILQAAVEAMQDKKAKKIVSLDLTKINNAVTSYFIICHAPSKTQLEAIYDNVLEFVRKECETKPYNKEGLENAEWILIDYVDVVVHIFLEDIRPFYNLEGLWADADIKEYESYD